MADKKKIDFKKQVLPVLLVIAALIIGVLFKDELAAILGTEGGYSEYYTSEAGAVYTAEAADTAEGEVVTEPTAEAESTTAATTTATEATTTAATTTTTAETTTTAPVESEQPDEVEIEYYFRSQAQYEQHYEKHGHEFIPIFGEITMEEYLMYANALIQSDDEEILTKTEKEDGDFMYFRPSTEEFLVLSTDGYIRTYFIPTAGIDYWNRQ